MDTSTSAGKLVITMLGAVAELERSLTVEGVRAGLRNARALEKRLGSGAEDSPMPRPATVVCSAP
jgi:putative DNA-invertase from lambdoid prophage Rac